MNDTQIFCSTCTGKFEVASKFKLKGKTGPSRVCFACIEKCQTESDTKALDSAKSNGSMPPPLRRPPSMVDTTESGNAGPGAGHGPSDSTPRGAATAAAAATVIIHPPEWVSAEDETECFHCHTVFKRKKHNCRACGRVFCPDCSTKINMPLEFLHKIKAGPTRVCNPCRFLIVSGSAILSVEPYRDQQMAPVPQAPREVPQTPSRRRATVSAQPENFLTVMWNEDKSFMAEVEITEDRSTLHVVHSKLLEARPELEDTDIVYLCRGKPIWREFWGMMKVKYLKPTVYVCRGDIETVLHELMVSGTLRSKSSTSKSSHSHSRHRNVNHDQHLASEPATSPIVTTTPGPVQSQESHAGQVDDIVVSAVISQPDTSVPANNMHAPEVDSKSTTPGKTSVAIDAAGAAEDILPPPPDPVIQCVSQSEQSQSESCTPASVTPASTDTDTGAAVSTAATAHHRHRHREYANVLYDFEPVQENQLMLVAGTRVRIIQRTQEKWWYGAISPLADTKHESNGVKKKQRGWFPASYVKLVVHKPQESSDSEAATATATAAEITAAQVP
jgi:FYVE zinc finger